MKNNLEITIGKSGQWQTSNIENRHYNYDELLPEPTEAFSIEEKLEMLRKAVNFLLIGTQLEEEDEI